MRILKYGYSYSRDNKYKEALRQIHKLSETLLLAELLPILRWVLWMISKYSDYDNAVNVLRELGRYTLQ